MLWRAGMVEQASRISIEKAFEQKVAILENPPIVEDKEDETTHGTLRTPSGLTTNATVDVETARIRLYQVEYNNWWRRHRAAAAERHRQEDKAIRDFRVPDREDKLPIKLAALQTKKAPLFRVAIEDLILSISDPGLSRDEIVDFMSDASSSKFDPATEFTLMVPVQLKMEFRSMKLTLRDYPIPLINIPAPNAPKVPAWTVDTLFVIGEEKQGPDSNLMIPSTIIPKGCGATNSAALVVDIAKTIMPVKTYTLPTIKIASQRTTEFSWGTSYQPAIQDFMKVIESFSHPPRDPSPRVGFWDKFRLTLHWRVTVDFTGPVHIYCKGKSCRTASADSRYV